MATPQARTALLAATGLAVAGVFAMTMGLRSEKQGSAKEGGPAGLQTQGGIENANADVNSMAVRKLMHGTQNPPNSSYKQGLDRA